MSISGPNILLIMTDQHRLDAINCYANGICRTPHIDRLADMGVRFETAYTVCPVCSPARASIMTGQYPHAHGITANIHDLGSSVHELSDRPSLLSRRLQALGYRCGYTGKWHLGSDRPRSFGAKNTTSLPADVGFTGMSVAGHGHGGFTTREYREYLSASRLSPRLRRERQVLRKIMDYGIVDDERETVPHFLANYTIRLVEELSQDSEPFFIWHSFWGPHHPYFSSSRFYDLYRDEEIPEWPNYRWDDLDERAPLQVKLLPNRKDSTWDDWAEAIRHYYAFVSLIDAQIGRLLDYLEERHLLDDTVIIFTSDHGETLGSHGGLFDKGWHHFEEIQRIPLIVYLPKKHFPERVLSGTTLKRWATTLDLYPTLLDIAGAAEPTVGVPGSSLLPTVHGDDAVRPRNVVVEFHGVNSLATSMLTLRSGRLKYGWNCSNRDELYDLERDPHEMHNLVADPAYQGDLARLRQELYWWMENESYPGRLLYRRSRLSYGEWDSKYGVR